MNWGRAKTILIILFLLVDIFFLVLLSYVQADIKYIKRDTIRQTTSVLNEHGITIKEEQIPKGRYKNKILNMKNLMYSPKWVATRFFGEDYDIVKEDETGSVYKKDDLTLFISENQFSLEKQREIEPISSFEETEDKLYKDLKKLGYSKKDIGFKDYYIKDGVCHIAAFHTFEGIKIDSSELIISSDKDGIINIGGVCFGEAEGKEEDEKLFDVTSVLVSMIYDPMYKGITVKKVELVYNRDLNAKNSAEITAYPVYVVTDINNREYMLKAM